MSTPKPVPQRLAASADSAVLASSSADAARLALPAYAALGLAIGAGCFALAHYVAQPGFAGHLYLALLLALGLSYGANYAGAAPVENSSSAAATSRKPFWRIWFGWARNLVLFLGVPLGVLLRLDFFAPGEVRGEPQTVVALLVGWLMIAGILVIGGRCSNDTLPIATPLVPALSLFGLLNIVQVDSEILFAFLVYGAGSLFVLCYERGTLSRPGAARRNSRRAAQSSGAAPTGTWQEAGSYGLASAAWIVILGVMGAALLGPMQLLLPRLALFGAGHVRYSQQMPTDWRGSSAVMELHGGDHSLSEREIMRVQLLAGRSPGLWRGRTYEAYSASRWQEMSLDDEATPIQNPEDAQPGAPATGKHGAQATEETLTSGPLSAAFVVPDSALRTPALPRALGRREEMTARVSMLAATAGTLYAPAEPVAVRRERADISNANGGKGNGGNGGTYLGQRHGRRHVLVRDDGTLTMTESAWRSGTSYQVRSSVPWTRLPGLLAAPGLSPAQLEAMRNDPDPLQYSLLRLPDDPQAQQELLAIVARITQEANEKHNPLKTPGQKVQAIASYLIQNCTYSLSVPPVPASSDATVWFLTRSHQGACDMFASSMALLLRAMNVPTRIATGYLEPDPDPDGDGKTYTIRERDAHAWVEYQIATPGGQSGQVCWLAYDPTQGTRLAPNSLPLQIAQMFHLPTWNLRPNLLFLPALGVLSLLIGAGWTLLEWRRGQPGQNAGETQSIARAYRQAARLLSRRVAPSPHLTPQEYEARVNRAPLSPEAKQEFAALTHLFVAARYSPQPPEVQDADLQAALLRLRRALK